MTESCHIILQDESRCQRRLHQVLEQLYLALKAWESSVKASTSLTGAFQPDRDYRQEERAVNVASIAFEEFHAKLGHLPWPWKMFFWGLQNAFGRIGKRFKHI